MSASIFDVKIEDFNASSDDGERIKLGDLAGNVVVLVADEFIESMDTMHGPSSAVRATIHDITNQKTYENQLIFPKVIVSGLKGKIGVPVLGVVGRGNAKPGRSAPWVLLQATEAQKAAAADYLKSV